MHTKEWMINHLASEVEFMPFFILNFQESSSNEHILTENVAFCLLHFSMLRNYRLNIMKTKHMRFIRVSHFRLSLLSGQFELKKKKLKNFD